MSALQEETRIGAEIRHLSELAGLQQDTDPSLQERAGRERLGHKLEGIRVQLALRLSQQEGHSIK